MVGCTICSRGKVTGERKPVITDGYDDDDDDDDDDDYDDAAAADNNNNNNNNNNKVKLSFCLSKHNAMKTY
jgi:hypothetical protein